MKPGVPPSPESLWFQAPLCKALTLPKAVRPPLETIARPSSFLAQQTSRPPPTPCPCMGSSVASPPGQMRPPTHRRPLHLTAAALILDLFKTEL